MSESGVTDEQHLLPRIVYSRHHDMGFFGIERLHPFDSRKYGKAWRRLRQHWGASLEHATSRPTRSIGREELLAVHSQAYLDRLRDPVYLAEVLELPPLEKLPSRIIDWAVLRPMRWATMGTVLAVRECLRHGFAVNLGGGYHHAKPSEGEGFCVYADIAVAVQAIRAAGSVDPQDLVAYVDLDAHQGNGVCYCFADDPSVLVFDMYNCEIYPGPDPVARDRIDCDVPVRCGCDDREYLSRLEARLPEFLDRVSPPRRIGLAIYNAGTDIHADDPLGALKVSTEGVLARDLFVVRELRRRDIPTAMLLSGGYTRISYELVADSVIRIAESAPGAVATSGL